MNSGMPLSLLINPKTSLLFTIGFMVAYFFFAHEGFYFDDDYSYAEMAGNLLHGTFSFQNFTEDLPANHRFLIFGPVAVLFKLFGISIYSVTLWPLLCTAGSVVLLYFLFRKEDRNVTIWALLLLGLNFHTLFLATYLFPDNILMGFAFAAAGILYAARRSGEKPKVYALLFVLANLAAFLSKETIAWYAPFYLLVAVSDFFNKKHTVFWRWSFGLGLLVLAGYLLCYRHFFGSFFYRFTMVENTNLIMTDNFLNDPAKTLWPRLTFAPISFFIGSGIWLPLAFCFRYFHSLTRKRILNLAEGENFWFWLAMLVLLQFWFGSTSVNHYNPITLIPRMATPLFPPLCLAAAYQLRNFFRDRSGAWWLAAPLLLAAISDRSAMSVVYGLPGLYFAVLGLQTQKFNTLTRPEFFTLVILFVLVLRPLHFMRKPSVMDFFAQDEIIRTLLENQAKQDKKTVLFVDGWLEKSAPYYFNFLPSGKVTVKNYEDLSPELLNRYQQAYFFINEKTLTNPDLQYFPPKSRFSFTVPEVYERFPNRQLVSQRGSARLFRVLPSKQ
jgi:4-amino-4-deoxy-L-arabinose transferase-like glycosyltransferase